MKLVTIIPGPCPAVGDWCIMKDDGEELLGYISHIAPDLHTIFLKSSEFTNLESPFLYREIKLLLAVVEVPEPTLAESEMIYLSRHFGADQ